MTPLTTYLDEIEKRLERATPGPWFKGSWYGKCSLHHQHSRKVCQYEYTKSDSACVSVEHIENMELIGYGDYGPVLSDKDAAFIAHSRTDLPRVVAMLRKAVEAIQVMADTGDNGCYSYGSKVLADLDRLANGGSDET